MSNAIAFFNLFITMYQYCKQRSSNWLLCVLHSIALKPENSHKHRQTVSWVSVVFWFVQKVQLNYSNLIVVSTFMKSAILFMNLLLGRQVGALLCGRVNYSANYVQLSEIKTKNTTALSLWAWSYSLATCCDSKNKAKLT